MMFEPTKTNFVFLWVVSFLWTGKFLCQRWVHSMFQKKQISCPRNRIQIDVMTQETCKQKTCTIIGETRKPLKRKQNYNRQQNVDVLTLWTWLSLLTTNSEGSWGSGVAPSKPTREAVQQWRRWEIGVGLGICLGGTENSALASPEWVENPFTNVQFLIYVLGQDNKARAEDKGVPDSLGQQYPNFCGRQNQLGCSWNKKDPWTHCEDFGSGILGWVALEA